MFISHGGMKDRGYEEIRVVFFDISKAFDRVWHKGLLYKIEKLGITGEFLHWIKSYLSERKQKVIINGKESTVIEINAGVPQGSILGPLFFLIFINDIVTDIGCNIKLFADDTSIYIIIDDPNVAAENLNNDLDRVHVWSKNWLVNFNPQKTETLLISRKQHNIIHPTLYFNNTPIKEVSSHKHLGLVFNKACHWDEHIDLITSKATRNLNILRNLKFDLDRKTLQTMYFSFIRPTLEYGDIIFDNCPLYSSEKLEKINTEAARIVTGATKLVSLSSLFAECGWEKLETRREIHKLTQFYKIKNNLTPEYISDLLPPEHHQQHNYNTRNPQNLVSFQCRTTYHQNSFFPSCVRLWNNLPRNIKESKSLSSFKNALSSYYNPSKVRSYYYTGSRRAQVLHARLRMRCSALQQHLFLRNIDPDPNCSNCTLNQIESVEHYLLRCPKYTVLRTEMLNSLNLTEPITCQLLIYGDERESYDYNCHIFSCVQSFIVKTKRFI